ncbi:MAG: cellulase family glycosylhydrolase [Clostridia bacterium]|nr:cellulase family glycosylhydrolase [Clostridia bacterium]
MVTSMLLSGGAIAGIVIGCVVGVLLIGLILALIILFTKKPNKNRPAKIDNPTGFVQAVGSNFYDGDGNIVFFHGINFGNWFIQEPWMAVSAVGDFEQDENGKDRPYTQQRGLDAMRANPNLNEDQIRELRELYIDKYIQEEDFKQVADLGMNIIRFPFSYRNFEGMDGFKYLDWALDMCEKYKIWAIIDFHGAYGSQNMDDHSGDDVSWNLYGNPENEAKTIALWEKIAERYKDRKIIMGYDLLNETRKAPHKFAGKLTFDFYDRLYKAIRAIDKNHMIIVEYFTFPIHGARLSHYNWENVAVQYHFYNLTPLPQKFVMNLMRAMHNWEQPKRCAVLSGEFCICTGDREWNIMLDWLQKMGWSYCSWTYKTNAFMYKTRENFKEYWGIIELNEPPVDLHTATYEEIKEKYEGVGSENAVRPSKLYNMYIARVEKDKLYGGPAKID